MKSKMWQTMLELEKRRNMSDKKSLNPLLLVVGLVAGAVGALVMSDAKTRKKATTALEQAKSKVKKTVADLEGLNKQKGLDKQKKKVSKR